MMQNGGKKREIRAFDWRDLFLVQRLQGEGLALDYELAHVDGVFPLRDALHNYLLLGTGSRQTLVMPGLETFAQYLCAPDSKQVHLTYLAPAPTTKDYAERWVEFLDHLVSVVGARGTHHIVAEARDDGPEMELFQRAGFGVFTRQVLFGLSRAPDLGKAVPELPGLRPWRPTDDWGVRLLYANIVPHIAQQIEAPSDSAFSSKRWKHRWVLERDGEIIASLAVRQGRAGGALRLLLHPEADIYVEALICHGLAKLAHGPAQPVYCRVRRYESWLHAPLLASGFTPVVRTALVVKHTVVRVMTPEWRLAPGIEGGTEMTRPIAQARLHKTKG
jgi:hypothetical protein